MRKWTEGGLREQAGGGGGERKMDDGSVRSKGVDKRVCECVCVGGGRKGHL